MLRRGKTIAWDNANPVGNDTINLGLAAVDRLIGQDALQAVIGNSQIFQLMTAKQRGNPYGIF